MEVSYFRHLVGNAIFGFQISVDMGIKLELRSHLKAPIRLFQTDYVGPIRSF